MGTTVAPGFEPADFEAGEGGRLEGEYPQYREWIRDLTG